MREKTIDFQNQYDFSDDEIRWLKRAGQLRITRTEFTVDTSRLMPIYGWVQLAIPSVVFCAAIFHVGFSAEPEWKRALGQMILGALWFGAGVALLKLFVTPWRTFKQSGVITSRQKTENTH